MIEFLGIALLIITTLFIYLIGKEDGRQEMCDEICKEILGGKDGKIEK